MAAVRTQEASSSISRCTCHVFLSFRSADTGKTFTDHLYAGLLNAGIHTFRYDDDKLVRRENVDSELQKSLEESRIVIIVFSKDYASSQRCLDEVVKILECKKAFGHAVLPVFYDVDPSQVRKQTGSFEGAFARHEEEFKEGTARIEDERKNEWMEKVKRWRAALREVADLGGMVLQNQADGHESKFIQNIIKEIVRKLNRTILSVAQYPIGIDSRVRSINLWLQDGSTSVGILVIYGMGGIGKTTIAKTVYNLNFDKFDGSSFLANIREASEQHNGLARLQRQLLSNVLKKKIKKIYNIDEGLIRIKKAICCKRVLVVLDDVDQLDQLKAIFGMRDWFYPGSKIIITTRHERLLKAHEVCELYKVRELDDKESLRLFSWHAFGKDHPFKDYTEQSRKIVNYCGGIPLALQVLGSSLSGKGVDVWESAIKKLQAIPNSDIVGKLKISYDSLPDDNVKNLFLDIACFFVGKDKDYVVTILDECGFYTTAEIQNLIDRCLLTIDKNKLLMHQLLQDMGRELIRQESRHPGLRSRLWSHKDSYNVLKGKTGTATIKGLVLDMKIQKEHKSAETRVSDDDSKRHRSEETLDILLPEVQGYSLKRRRLDYHRHSTNSTSKISGDLDFETNAFARMQRLQYLQLSYVQLNGCYKKFPKQLRWLHWRGFPLESIPSDFPLENLVAFDMRNSRLTQFWEGTKFLGLLKIIDLSHSLDLIKTPEFVLLPSLERMILKGCISLVEVHESIAVLKKLFYLNLRDCRSLRKLPGKIVMLKCLEELILSGCSNLEELPKDLGKMESLKVLNADEITINQLASTTGWFKLWYLHFRSWVSKPQRTPYFSLASLPRSLVRLSLMDCNISDDSIPRDLSSLPSLGKLYLGGNPISRLPESIKGLTMLHSLHLDLCRRLQSLPELPSGLKLLNAESCTSLERITNLPNWLKSLDLELCDCTNLVEIAGLFKLEPIGDISAKMGNLGLADFQSKENLEVDLFNNITQSGKKGPAQGLNEFGIFSTFLPGSEVPGWFSYKSMGSSITFVVPSPLNLKIQGLNMCVVYALPEHDGGWVSEENYLIISNESKGLKWTYTPTFFGMLSVNNDMLWLSHWRFGDQLEGGDQVCVSYDLNSYFQVKDCGVHLLYMQEEEVIQNNSYPYQNLTRGNMSVHDTRTGAYLLCNYGCMKRRQYGWDPFDIAESTDDEDEEENE